jgi:cell division protein FtsL
MIDTMSKKPRKKKKKKGAQQQSATQKQNTKYSAGEIAMAILGAALLIMAAGIIITSCLG